MKTKISKIALWLNLALNLYFFVMVSLYVFKVIVLPIELLSSFAWLTSFDALFFTLESLRQALKE